MEKPRKPVWGKPPKFKKGKRQRQRGNFARRFFYKYILGVWPPAAVPERPAPPGPPPPPQPVFYEEAYNIVDLLRQHRAKLVHVYYGHKAVKYLPMIQRWGGPMIVSFHGMDITAGAYKPGDPATLAEVFSRMRASCWAAANRCSRDWPISGVPPEKLRLKSHRDSARTFTRF